MATMAADPVFVDTNVLVYVSRPTAPEHPMARAALGRLNADGCAIWISTQVMRDYLAVVTRPQAGNCCTTAGGGRDSGRTAISHII